MKYLFLLSILVFTGCQQMPAKASFVKKLAKNHQSAAQVTHSLIVQLHQADLLTGPQAMRLLMDSAGTLARATEISQEPASIGLPPGMGQVGKGIFGMMMGNPMALSALGSGLLAVLGTGTLAIRERKKRIAMNEEGRDLRDADPAEAAKKWERSENFKS